MLDSFAIEGYALLAPGRTDIWLEPTVEGFSAPEYRQSTSNNSGEDGARLDSAFYGGRLLKLSGVLTADSSTRLAELRRNLQAVCRLERDAAGRPVLKRFDLTTVDGLALFAYGATRPVIFGSENPNWCKFLIQAFCPDSQLFIDTLVSSGQVPTSSGGGAIYPVTYPVTYTASVGGGATVTNSGNADTWPVITLHGPLTSPTASHQESGKIVRLNTTLSSTDSAVIDMKEKTIVPNGSSSLMAYRSDESDWFSLQPGNNTIRLLTDVSGDTGTMEVTFNPAVLGL